MYTRTLVRKSFSTDSRVHPLANIGLPKILRYCPKSVKRYIFNFSVSSKRRKSEEDNSEFSDNKTYTRMKISTKDLLPGDLVLLKNGLRLDSDLLLLRGTCMANEATFTGENYPVWKRGCLDLKRLSSGQGKPLVESGIILETKPHETQEPTDALEDLQNKKEIKVEMHRSAEIEGDVDSIYEMFEGDSGLRRRHASNWGDGDGQKRPDIEVKDASGGTGSLEIKPELDFAGFSQEELIYSSTNLILPEDSCALALVLKTGWDSKKGDLLSEMRRQQRGLPMLQRELVYMSMFLIFFGVVGIFCLYLIYANHPNFELSMLGEKAIEVIASVLPPAMFLSISIALEIGYRRLQSKGVGSRDVERLFEASKTAIVLFDKTGTLTTMEAEVSFFVTAEDVERRDISVGVDELSGCLGFREFVETMGLCHGLQRDYERGKGVDESDQQKHDWKHANESYVESDSEMGDQSQSPVQKLVVSENYSGDEGDITEKKESLQEPDKEVKRRKEGQEDHAEGMGTGPYADKFYKSTLSHGGSEVTEDIKESRELTDIFEEKEESTKEERRRRRKLKRRKRESRRMSKLRPELLPVKVIGDTIDKALFDAINWTMIRKSKNKKRNSLVQSRPVFESKNKAEINPNPETKTKTQLQRQSFEKSFGQKSEVIPDKIETKFGEEISSKLMHLMANVEVDPFNMPVLPDKFFCQRMQIGSDFKYSKIRSFEFDYNYRRMSVVIGHKTNANRLSDLILPAQANRDDRSSREKFAKKNPMTYKVLTKGAPESVAQICDPRTVPSDLDKVVRMFASKGLKAIGVSARLLKHEQLDLKRGHLESGHTFLGLVFLNNPLQYRARETVQLLDQSLLKTALVTGDNIHTAISIAVASHIIKPNTSLYVGQYNTDLQRVVFENLPWKSLENKLFRSLKCEDDIEKFKKEVFNSHKIYNDLQKMAEERQMHDRIRVKTPLVIDIDLGNLKFPMLNYLIVDESFVNI